MCQEVTTKLVFGGKSATQCDPNTTCCDATGSYAAKTTKCGTKELAAEYKCSSSAKGGDVLVRKAYAGCAGGNISCSTAQSNWSWSAWTVAKDCKTTEVCSVLSIGTPGTCKTSALQICSAADTFEASSNGAFFNVGSFADNDPAKMIDNDPKKTTDSGVHFNGPDDSDYLSWHIDDNANLANPRVQIDWTGGDNVEVCAWYRCEKGPFGEDCDPVKCPSGSQSSQNWSVSFGEPNGCCMTAQKGSLAFSVNAPGTTDETGRVYARFTNAGPVCQWVNTKIVFDGKTEACGDGICEGSESSSCGNDCGSCGGLCGNVNGDKGSVCHCDAACAGIGDCCWDINLVCVQ